MLKVRGPAADACSRYSHDIYVIATRNLQGINVQWNVGGDAPNIYLLYDDPLRLLACVTHTQSVRPCICAKSKSGSGEGETFENSLQHARW
jgi:hypothetical protein